jgi:hypothetical protein
MSTVPQKHYAFGAFGPFEGVSSKMENIGLLDIPTVSIILRSRHFLHGCEIDFPVSHSFFDFITVSYH